MGKVALLFAGQGAQRPGMCEALSAREPAAAGVFAMADEVRPGTSAQCFSGTKEELALTQNTQPCVFAADLACARALAAHGVRADFVAGFSLGEVAALAFAGSLSDEAAMRLVCRRAELMADAAERHPGGMRAVLRLDSATVEALATEVGDVWTVNYNSPQQTVVAGLPASLERLDALVLEMGGRSCVLAVSGAFHSPLMASASAGLAEYLASACELGAPAMTVISNVTGGPYPAAGRPSAARAELLARQVASPVQWVRSLEYLQAQGVDTFIEVGPGKTLAGLVGRTLGGARALSCETPGQLDAVVAELGLSGEANYREEA